MEVGDPYALAREAANDLRRRGFDDHDVLLVLGSGWSAAVDAFEKPLRSVPFAVVPGFVTPVAEGHGHEIRSYAVGAGPRPCRRDAPRAFGEYPRDPPPQGGTCEQA